MSSVYQPKKELAKIKVVSSQYYKNNIINAKNINQD